MSNYFCPDCGYQSYEDNESICPHCNLAMEKLDYKDDVNSSQGTYPDKVLKEVGDEENIDPAILPEDDLGYKDKDDEI